MKVFICCLTLCLCPALCGCGNPAPSAPAQTPVGDWQGTRTMGNVAAASIWQFQADGTQTSTLTLPQGALTAQGTWTLHGGTLTVRTTRRRVDIGSLSRTMPLVHPLETQYACAASGDTLRLTRPGGNETLTLKREGQ